MAAAGNDGVSQAGSSSLSNGDRPNYRGRGWSDSHRGERSVRPRFSRDEYRYWLHARKKPPISHERFVLVSYNILADVNARTHWRELYYHIPRHIIDWHARKRKLLRELGLWSPDIICLQEVDRYDDLNEEFQKEGYVGVYTGRTGTADDGCAMFWRQERFDLLEEESIEFREHKLRDNVAQLCVLQTKSRTVEPSNSKEEPKSSCLSESENNRVVVGNIHVLFNPKRGDVKLGQVRVLLEKARRISEKWGNAPVAIAGDFNSTPTSALYQFISSAELDLVGHDRRNISGQEDDGEDEGSRTDDLPNTVSRVERFDMSSGVESEALEEPASDPESSIISMKSVEYEESTIARIGDVHLATDYMHTKTTRVSVERYSDNRRLSVPKSVRMSYGFSGQFRNMLNASGPVVCRVRGWAQEELVAATGDKQLSVVRHNLKLHSSYAQIEGNPGSRDKRGEPFVTTYHRKFMGTVDYIWHTDGLCTVRVLDTIPTSILQLNQGLPSKDVKLVIS